MILVIALIVFCMSGFQLFKIGKGYLDGRSEYDKVRKLAVTDDKNKNDKEEKEELTEEKLNIRKQKIKKAAFGALGGVIGFGLSFAFQPGTAGTVISIGRLVYSTTKKGLKVYTEKHKDDKNNKVIKIVGRVKKLTKEQAEKHPKITSVVVKANNFLKKPETQVFLNGMAVPIAMS